MITLEELKTYLAITDSGKDEFLKSLIEMATTKFENMCNRKFLRDTYTELIINNLYSGRIYLSSLPIISVTSIKYFDTGSYGYTNLFTGTDTELNSTEIRTNYITITKPSYLVNRTMEIVYVAGYKFQPGSGTISTTAGSKNVSGIGTLFTTELIVGDTIIIHGETKRIATITDATTLVLTENISNTYSNIDFIISDVPADIRKTIRDIAAYSFQESDLGNKLLYKDSVSLNSDGSASEQFRRLNVDDIVNYYRVLNI